MLILTRKQGQRIMLGNDVSITVLSISGSQIKLGISAPSTTPVHREEIFLRLNNDLKKEKVS